MKIEKLSAAGGIALLGIGPCELYAQQPRPNILIIVADDCSYYDIGCYGAKNNATPNIDRLVADGCKFENAYNSASMSTPTRHSLYTGMYPMKHGGYANHSRIKDGIKSMPVYLRELGYRVGLTGKWHIAPRSGFPFENVPGFTEDCVATEVSHTMDGVVEFITRDSGEPFCLVVASINPHAPWTAGDASKYDPAKLILPPIFADTDITRKEYAAYLAEIDLLDGEVGDMVGLLKDKKLYDNTVVFFLSEQGAQFAGAKWTNWTPGVKAAMAVTWPGIIKPRSATMAIVQYEDILPTIIEIAKGTPGDAIDGKSILPVITGRTKRHREYAFHVHNNIPEGPAYPIRAVSDGKYRLIWNLTFENQYIEKHVENDNWFVSWKESPDKHARYIVNRWRYRPEFELYNVSKDNFEFKNLAYDKKYEKVRARLFAVLQEWMLSQGDSGIKADIRK